LQREASGIDLLRATRRACDAQWFEQAERNVTTTIEIKVPDIGDFSDVPVIEVLVSAGDRVNAEDSLVTLESDKATMEVPAPRPGVIREMRLKVNDKVSKGDVVAIKLLNRQKPSPYINRNGAPREVTATSEVKPGPNQPQSAPNESASGGCVAAVSAPPSVELPAPAGPPAVPYASPSVRKFARELGADLRRVTGSGAKGRISQEDVAKYVKSVLTSPPQPVRTGLAGFDLPPRPKVDYSQFGKITEQPLSRIRWRSRTMGCAASLSRRCSTRRHRRAVSLRKIRQAHRQFS
jgi:pyruvate dehydrogenase E2 component (dihydrolipoamide acetyltransferase)